MVQRDQWDTYWGPKKIYLLIRDIDDATTATLWMDGELCVNIGAVRALD